VNAHRHPFERFTGQPREGATGMALVPVPADPRTRGQQRGQASEDGAVGPWLSVATGLAMLGITAALAALVQLLA
jgi:hypothetical protein